MNKWDYLGQWPTWRLNPVHQKSMRRVYVGASPNLLAGMSAGQLWADSPQFQGTQFSYIHAQRASDQPKQDALGQTNNFISAMVSMARYVGTDSEYYGFFVAAASHPAQDHTSSPHQNQSVWKGTGDVVSIVLALLHVLRELRDAGAGSDLDLATQFMKERIEAGPEGDPKDWIGALDQYILERRQTEARERQNSEPIYSYSLDSDRSYVTDSNPITSHLIDLEFQRINNNPSYRNDAGAARADFDLAKGEAIVAGMELSNYQWLASDQPGDLPAGMLTSHLWQAHWALKFGDTDGAIHEINAYEAAQQVAKIKSRNKQ